MNGCLHNLMCLSVIISAGIYTTNQLKDKDFLGFNEGQKIGRLIGTTNSMNNTIYYIDTDNDLKSAEYISTIHAGSYAETQMSAQLFNEKRVIECMPLKKWREFSDTFQMVKERF